MWRIGHGANAAALSGLERGHARNNVCRQPLRLSLWGPFCEGGVTAAAAACAMTQTSDRFGSSQDWRR
jgi:hypothetical protein